MNISLKNRIAWSFVITMVIVLIMGFTVFFFLDSLNNKIVAITTNSNSVSSLNDEARSSIVELLDVQRKFTLKKANEDDFETFNDDLEKLNSQLSRLENYYKDVSIKTQIATLQSSVDLMRDTLSKVTYKSLQGRDYSKLLYLEDLVSKALQQFSQFQSEQLTINEKKEDELNKTISETRKSMLISLILTFLGTILLGLVVPGKIALPFKKISDAIRELQECNFDVSIYYNQDDEIGELAREINKMINSLKTFEQLRTDRINVEHRKFDTLANMMKKFVLVANAEGELIYMNNSLYGLLGIQSEDVMSKDFSTTSIPICIKDSYELAIKRRSKIENAVIEIPSKENGDQVLEAEQSEEEKFLFRGYANVIPVRGKQSQLDYYIMVISKEVFS